MSKSKLKKILIPVIAVIVAAAILFGALTVVRNVTAGSVNVYPVSDFAMTDYLGDATEAYGYVRTEGLQQVYPSDTMNVTEIYVTEGQEVNEGDPLLAYDTTLTDISLQRADINCQKLQLQLETAKRELETIKSMRPHSSTLITPTSDITYTPVATPSLVSGAGTEDDPYYYIWDSEDTLTTQMLQDLYDEWVANGSGAAAGAADEGEDGEGGDDAAAAEEPGTMLYIAFVTRYNNALNGAVESYWGLAVDCSDGVKMQWYDAVLSDEIMACDEEPEPYYKESGSDYTAAEIAQMRADKEEEIEKLEIDVKTAEVDKQSLEAEKNDSTVYAQTAGTVKTVNDPDEAAANGEPIITVSAGGGYCIDVAMSELDLDSMTVGQYVDVNDWETGAYCSGSVTEVSEYPTDNADSWSSGNSNVSWYPFTIFVSEEDGEGLRSGDYVSVTYSSAANTGSGFYVEAMFVRNEGGRSFMYVEGKDGKLEERTVQTGMNLWGSYIEIRGGITVDDQMAFPYGKNVKDGAKIKECTSDQFYSDAYGGSSVYY